MAKFMVGQKITVADTHSPHNGRAGTVERLVFEENRLLYRIRFGWSYGLVSVENFKEEQLRKVD